MILCNDEIMQCDRERLCSKNKKKTFLSHLCLNPSYSRFIQDNLALVLLVL